MIENIKQREELGAVAKSAARLIDQKTVRLEDAEEAEAKGWEIINLGKRTARIQRDKPRSTQLEDRIWLLLYRFGFSHLSLGNRSQLIQDDSGGKATYQLDALALDDEVVIVAEAKSQANLGKLATLPDDLARLDSLRLKILNSVKEQFPAKSKRIVIPCLVVDNVILTPTDKARADELKIHLIDQEDLAYYEALAHQIGEAAKYQFLSDLIPGRTVPGLEIRVPAIKGKMGGFNCYTFSISPEYLIKIAYVSHRAKGRGSDLGAYQRMLTKARLSKIRQYISNGGVFPTNIVVNVDKGRNLKFEKAAQSTTGEGGVFGWLVLKPAYRTAWIIDGQHRTFAYAGHAKAGASQVTVLAFEGLHPSKQAELFIDINAKQKSVKRSLLEELYADLRKDANSEVERIRSVMARAVLALDVNVSSPLRGIIKRSEDSRDHRRCVTLTAVVDALDRHGMYACKVTDDRIIVPGALWAKDDASTLSRSIEVLTAWFQRIRSAVPNWWDLGSASGGGLAMNNGVTICINILRSVFEVLDARGIKLYDLSDKELTGIIDPYAVALAECLKEYSTDDRRRFRQLQGVTGQTTGTRRLQAQMAELLDDYAPEGLAEFLEFEKRETNKRAKELLDEIEVHMQSLVLNGIKEHYGASEDGWWFQAVPSTVRTKVDQRRNEDSASRGGREYYFDLIDYRTIIQQGDIWGIFRDIVSYGDANGKEKATKWMVDVNDIRRIVAHSSSGKAVSVEQLTFVEDIHSWLVGQNDVDGLGEGDE